MNCREVLARLYEYLDTELDDKDRKSVDSHLEFCGDCLKKYKLEEEFNKVIKSKCASKSDVANLKSRVLTEIDKMDRAGGGSGSRGLLYLLAPLAAAIIITLLFVPGLLNTSESPTRAEVLGPFASEHSKCLSELKEFMIESADSQEVHAVMAEMGVLPQQLFSDRNGTVSLMKGGVAHTKYGTGTHLDYIMGDGNVSLIILPEGTFSKKCLEEVVHEGKTFYFGQCSRFQYVVWEWDGQDYIAVSEMDENSLIGFVSTF